MIIGLCREHAPGETRVAMTPSNIKALVDQHQRCLVQAGAGESASFSDADYREAGADIADDVDTLYQQADVIIGIQPISPDSQQRETDLARLRDGQLLIGMMDPLSEPELAKTLAQRGVTALSLELVPRISRAQSMDVLTSMATLGGYHAVLLGASEAPRILPLMMTAAGTLQPAQVLILGVGVAGLQACATAKRLGAVVHAYDIRPAARDQIISVGALPVDLELDNTEAETAGGYAKEQSADQLAQQQAALAKVLATMDIIITTAAVPGRRAPVLITDEMAKSLRPGTVVVDLAAERGGNCALTRAGETVMHEGVKVIGPLNLAARHPLHASQMFGHNITTLLSHFINDEGKLVLDYQDEIVYSTVIAHQGEVPQATIRELLGLPALEKSTDSDSTAETTGEK